MCRHFNVFEHENTPSKILKHSMYIRPTLKILMFPHTRPCFTGMGRSVVNLFFNLKSQFGCPLSLIVNRKTCLKRPLKKRHYLIQDKSIAECSQGVFCNTFDLHLAPICLYDL